MLRNYASSIATADNEHDKIGAIALPLIIVSSAAIGRGLAVQTDRWGLTYPNLMGYVNASSGDIKTLVFDLANEPVTEFAEEYKDYFDEVIVPRIRAAQMRKSAELKAATKRLEADVKNKIPNFTIDTRLSEINKDLAQLEKAIQLYPVRSKDFTPEALIEKEIRRTHVFVASDEAETVEAVIRGRYRDQSEEDLFCSLYSGSPHERERAGKEGSKDQVPGMSGTILLMGQEHITQRMFSDEDFIKSGLIPRFLFCSVDGLMKKTDRMVPEINKEHRKSYCDFVKFLFREYWSPELDDNDMEKGPREVIGVTLAHEALNAFHDFHDQWVDRANSDLMDLTRHIKRLRENALKVAVIFHMAKLKVYKDGDATFDKVSRGRQRWKQSTLLGGASNVCCIRTALKVTIQSRRAKPDILAESRCEP